MTLNSKKTMRMVAGRGKDRPSSGGAEVEIWLKLTFLKLLWYDNVDSRVGNRRIAAANMIFGELGNAGLYKRAFLH